MTPPPVDRGVIGSRLRLIRNTLGDLGALADVTADELATDAIETSMWRSSRQPSHAH